MGKIEISIIMGIYNCERYLRASIDSILNQTFENWELIMCDDGSSDKTFYIAQEYQARYPDRITVIRNKKNLGLNETLNKCLELAKGKYVARQDGDDISLKNRLEEEYDFLEKNEQYALVSARMSYFDENGVWGESKKISEPTRNDFVKGSPFAHAPVLIRKRVIDEVGGYSVDKKLLRVEDYHLWFKIYAKGYKGYNLNKILYEMRDGKEAYKRRNLQNRINETRVRFIGYKMLKIPFYKYIYCLRPMLVYLAPKKIYNYLHKKNNSLEGKNEENK